MAALHEQRVRAFDLSIGNHKHKRRFGVQKFPPIGISVALCWRGIPYVLRDRAAQRLSRLLQASPERSVNPRPATMPASARGKPSLTRPHARFTKPCIPGSAARRASHGKGCDNTNAAPSPATACAPAVP